MRTAQKNGYSQSAALLAHEDAAKGGSFIKLHSEYKPAGYSLAAQLYGEFKEMFPENAVEYFVS